MLYRIPHTISFIVSGFILLGTSGCEPSGPPASATGELREATSDLYGPADHFFIQRAWPDRKPDLKGFEAGLAQARATNRRNASILPGFSGSWTLQGPTNIGGRINVILAHPVNPDTLFAGCATGGIFRSYDAGNSWTPVFDAQPFLAIGSLAFEPGNPSVIYAGTGDPNISGYPFIGDGIYRSQDGGTTWTHLGLTDQRIVSKIIVDPQNPAILYAATMGLPFERNTDRGLYKSTDGGTTWTQVLFISDQAGITDLVMDPGNSQVLYAAGWDRIRNNEESLVAGPGAKIYKTTDGGATWNILTNGLPQNDMSRIGLAIAQSNPDILYAVYVDDQLNFSGIYKTLNGGVSWTLLPANGVDPGFMGGFGWYFGCIRVNPLNPNELFVGGIDLYKSINGGIDWIFADNNFQTHSDKHDLTFLNNGDVLLATDGGMYRSTNGGTQWIDAEHIPNTQFYRVTSDPFVPGVYAGGAQDNGTVRGGAAAPDNWEKLFGADGFTILYDPTDPDIYYMETQNGDIWATSDGGFIVDYIAATIDGSDRRNWDMPYIMSPQNPSVLYAGTYRVYKNVSGPADAWTPISPDLTDGIVFEPRFHNITTLSESPLNSNFLYAGTSDGNVWRSLDGGNTWNQVNGTLPDRYVTSVKASPNNANVVFATVSGYKYNDFVPHVFRSANQGTTWTDISGNLPALAANDLVVYPGNDNILMLATDGGVYATVDGGTLWERVGSNMPFAPVYDIELDEPGGQLVAGTHARSLMTYPMDSILLATGLPHLAPSGTMRVYPSPAHYQVHVRIPAAENGSLTIYNLSGKQVWQQTGCRSGTQSIPVEGWKPGIYIIWYTEGDTRTAQKFVVQ